MDRIGIEFLSVFSLPPVEYINLAADLNVANISLAPGTIPVNPENYPAFSLLDDKPLRVATRNALRDRGVTISLGEGMVVMPGRNMADRQAELDLMLELGVGRVNTVSLDPDRARSFDEFARLAEMGAACGLEVTLEFSPGLTITDLPTALAAITHVGKPNFGLLLDTMHLIRSGASLADLAALPPGLIRYVQLSDVPVVPVIQDYMQEGMCERLSPGQGELPLAEILALCPRDVVVSLEIPQLTKALAGIGPKDRVRPCIQAARAMLSQLPN